MPLTTQNESNCFIPEVVRGAWFSWETGRNTLTEINAETMSNRGTCIAMKEYARLNYTFIFQKDACYHCVQLIVRTINVLEKVERSFINYIDNYLLLNNICLLISCFFLVVHCVNLRPGLEPTFANLCQGLHSDQQLITLFSENYKAVNCRSSLEGVWKFAYQVNP